MKHCFYKIMTNFMRLLSHSFRSSIIRKVNLFRNIFGLKRMGLVPRAPEGLDLKKFKPFYSLPAVRVIYFFGSLKYLKTGVCLAILWHCFFAYRQNKISENTWILIQIIGMYSILISYGASYLARNLVGKMYTNGSKSHIIISSVNSRGYRINNTYEADKVLLSDHPSPIARKYFKQIICTKENLKYNLYCHRGIQFDIFTFVKIFPNFE